MPNYSIPHYLDASVVVKLISREPGSELIEPYIRTKSAAHFYITEFVFYEVLGVLKRKWLKRELTENQYFSSVSVLESYLEEKLITIDRDFRPDDRSLLLALRDIVGRRKIDYSDALQIHAVINGKMKSHIGECKTVLVTADKDLVVAARLEGLRVWDFPNGEPPDHEAPDL